MESAAGVSRNPAAVEVSPVRRTRKHSSRTTTAGPVSVSPKQGIQEQPFGPTLDEASAEFADHGMIEARVGKLQAQGIGGSASGGGVYASLAKVSCTFASPTSTGFFASGAGTRTGGAVG